MGSVVGGRVGFLNSWKSGRLVRKFCKIFDMRNTPDRYYETARRINSPGYVLDFIVK